MHKFSALTTLARAGAVAVLATSMVAPAYAATLTPLYATGGTAAAFAYYDLANAQLFPNSADTGATCGATSDCAVEQLYAATGTGGAQASFLVHAVDGTVGSGEPVCSDGVNLPGIWLAPQPACPFAANPYPGTVLDIDYSAGDAPLNTTQLATYASTEQATYGAAIVAPTMGVPIAIPFNGTNTGLPAGQTLQLSMPTLCGIFEGTINNWDNAAIAADNPGVTFNNLPINVVVRSDGSGSTFIFSDALDYKTNCGAAFTTAVGGVGIGGGGLAPTGTVAPVWPATFDAQKGSGGVAAEVNLKPGSVGYVSVNYTSLFTAGDPPAAAVKNSKGTFETPTVPASILGLKGPYDTAGPCGTAQGVETCYPKPVTNQILYNSHPSNAGAYPIVGFTYGYFYQCSDTKTTTTALTGTKSLFTSYIYKAEVGGAATPADTIIESVGLVPLTNGVKSNSVKLIKTDAGHIRNGPDTGVCTIVAH